MKKVKITFWILIIGFIILVIVQNQEFFLAKQRLSVDLAVAAYYTPDLPIALHFLAFFLAGLLVAFIINLFERFRSKKIIKALKQKITTQENTIAGLQKEAEMLESPTESVPSPPPAELSENNESAQPQA